MTTEINNNQRQILAKSEPAVTLSEHISDCLNIVKYLRLCIPNIPVEDRNKFWSALEYAMVFHDSGKCHRDFQKMLMGMKNDWHNRRHEIFSMYFIENSDLTADLKTIIGFGVIGHHKSIKDIRLKITTDYLRNSNIVSFEEEQTFEKDCDLLKNRTWKILNSFKVNRATDVVPDIVSLSKKYYELGLNVPNTELYIPFLLMSGFIKQSDHLASAGIQRIEKSSDINTDFIYEYPLYYHQKLASDILGNVILTSPTGSGKTETSLLWMKQQLNNRGEGRVFYILPYTASINAMYERLDYRFGKSECGNPYVGMMHGKLSNYLDKKFDSDDSSYIKETKEFFKSLVPPFKILTPFQMLKHIFGLKGFEKGIAEWAGAYFIFDEIHAYDSSIFAQIIVLLEFCCDKMLTNVFVMTATLPTFMKQLIQKAIGKHSEIKADDSLYSNFVRHSVRIEKGLLFDSIDVINNDILSGKKVLIVCNTVLQSQEVYNQIDCDNKLLLHGSFNAEDRARIEQKLQSENIQVLVGTQAIEVSLDIDYDTIYSEPAPLDALIQRFGRVNRKRQKGICVCHVFDSPNENDHYIYDPKSVERTLQVLRKIENNGATIYEQELQNYIDFVYPCYTDKQQTEFDTTYNALRDCVNNSLRPLFYDEKTEEDFYRQFDGAKVLPVKMIDRYQEYLINRQFVKAEGLLVSVTKGRFCAMLSKEQIYRQSFSYEKGDKVLEDHAFVILRKYDSELGLLINEIEKENADNFMF